MRQAFFRRVNYGTSFVAVHANECTCGYVTMIRWSGTGRTIEYTLTISSFLTMLRVITKNSGLIIPQIRTNAHNELAGMRFRAQIETAFNIEAGIFHRRYRDLTIIVHSDRTIHNHDNQRRSRNCSISLRASGPLADRERFLPCQFMREYIYIYYIYIYIYPLNFLAIDLRGFIVTRKKQERKRNMKHEIDPTLPCISFFFATWVATGGGEETKRKTANTNWETASRHSVNRWPPAN